MTMQAFTSNYADNSTEAGFQFTFYCDLCREGYKTKFIEAKSYKKANLLRGISRLANLGATLAGGQTIGYNIERGMDTLRERFQGMSPEWHREHEKAFELAQNEAQQHFHRCPRCRRWVCDNDWNEQEGLCVQDAPRLNVEVVAARAAKAVADIAAKVEQKQIYKGTVDAKPTICPQCGKPCGTGKFCVNCGASLEMVKCPKCGAQHAAGTKFCGECGTRLE